MADGALDPLDFRFEELCAGCGGAGVVTDWGGKDIPVHEERKPGFVADQIGAVAFWRR